MMRIHHLVETRRRDQASELSTRAAAECACAGLRRAARAVSRIYGAAFAPLELTATQFSILVAVQLRGPVPLSRLAERLGLDRTTLYRALKPLVRRRCLRIRPGRGGREQTAALTGAGERLLEQALPVWDGIQRRFVDALGAPAWAALAAGVRDVVSTAQRVGAARPRAATARRRAPRP
jgi:DNA-binding MarR family transcriptional regulator